MKPSIKEFWSQLNRYDRRCRKCRQMKPIKGGRIIKRQNLPQVFTCADCLQVTP